MNEILRSFQSPRAILQTDDKINTFSTTFCYHRQVSMVFKGTITIEWNGLGQPLGSTIFLWFWGQVTIGFDGCPPLVRRWNGYMVT